MQANLTGAPFFHQAHELLKAHESMLGDPRRNRAFHRALQKLVRKDSCVLDIGAGTGIWAIIAARLGAKRVVAIERHEMLVGLIKGLAHANDVSARIEVVQGDSRHVTLGRDFDLLVTETIGNIGYEEQIASIVVDARTRFLKPDGVVIPQSVTLAAAAAHVQPRRHTLPAGIRLQYGEFEEIVLDSPLELTRNVRFRILSEPRDLIRTDLTSVQSLPDLTRLTATWQDMEVEGVNSVVVWAEATLAPGVRLTTLGTTSWTPVFYRFRPFDQEHGTLEFKLSLRPESNYWSATLTGAQGSQTHTHSPAFAAAELAARARMAPAAFLQLKQLGLLARQLGT